MRFQVLINKLERCCSAGRVFFFFFSPLNKVEKDLFIFLPISFGSPSLLRGVEPTSSLKWSPSIITTLIVSPTLTEGQEQTALRLFKWHTAYSVQTDVQSYGRRNKRVLGTVSTFFPGGATIKTNHGRRKVQILLSQHWLTSTVGTSLLENCCSLLGAMLYMNLSMP